MAGLIRHRRVVVDNWRLLDIESEKLLIPGEDGLVPDIPDGDLVAPLRLWRIRRADLMERKGRLGVLLDAKDDPAPIAPDLQHFDLVAIEFERFSDGRGYSLARLLRGRLGYRGELRATGDIGRDSLFGLGQCGFDSFVLRAGENPHEALAAFHDFRNGNQPSVEAARASPGHGFAPA